MQLFHFLGIIARKAFKDFKGDRCVIEQLEKFKIIGLLSSPFFRTAAWVTVI